MEVNFQTRLASSHRDRTRTSWTSTYDMTQSCGTLPTITVLHQSQQHTFLVDQYLLPAERWTNVTSHLFAQCNRIFGDLDVVSHRRLRATTRSLFRGPSQDQGYGGRVPEQDPRPSILMQALGAKPKSGFRMQISLAPWQITLFWWPLACISLLSLSPLVDSILTIAGDVF